MNHCEHSASDELTISDIGPRPLSTRARKNCCRSPPSQNSIAIQIHVASTNASWYRTMCGCLSVDKICTCDDALVWWVSIVPEYVNVRRAHDGSNDAVKMLRTYGTSFEIALSSASCRPSSSIRFSAWTSPVRRSVATLTSPNDPLPTGMNDGKLSTKSEIRSINACPIHVGRSIKRKMGS